MALINSGMIAKSIILSIFILNVFCIQFPAFCQTQKMIKLWQDSTFYKRTDTRYNFDEEENIYSLMNRMRKANEDSYYFTFAKTIQQIDPIPPFRTSAGELPNSILELRLVDRFNVISWDEKVSRDFWARAKFLYVNYDFTYRLGKRDKSDSIKDSPGLPLNTIFGFTIYEQIFMINKFDWAEYRKRGDRDLIDVPKPFSTNLLDSGFLKKKNLNFWMARFDIMHYSNGQDFGARITDTLTNVSRNDYLTGNFSTNYLETRVRYLETNRKGQLLDIELGLRRDIAIGEFLTYEEAQEDRYGRWFVNSSIQFRTGPIRLFWNLRDPQFTKAKYKWKTGATRFYPRMDRVPGLGEIAIRLSTQHAMGKLPLAPDQFRYKNGIDLKIEYIPLFSPEWSFFVGAYYGRDFLNIRYDLPVWLIKGAVSFQVGRYRPSTSSMINKVYQIEHR